MGGGDSASIQFFPSPLIDPATVSSRTLYAPCFQKVAELREARHVDFKFELADILGVIDPSGFEKYERVDGQTWLVDDLEIRVNVEVK